MKEFINDNSSLHIINSLVKITMYSRLLDNLTFQLQNSKSSSFEYTIYSLAYLIIPKNQRLVGWIFGFLIFFMLKGLSHI